MKWFTLSWYQYLFAPMKSRYDDEWHWRIRMVYCRAKGHDGVVWFNPNGMEPDMTCKRCGENIG